VLCSGTPARVLDPLRHAPRRTGVLLRPPSLSRLSKLELGYERSTPYRKGILNAADTRSCCRRGENFPSHVRSRGGNRSPRPCVNYRSYRGLIDGGSHGLESSRRKLEASQRPGQGEVGKAD